jgi:hypothetical protein
MGARSIVLAAILGFAASGCGSDTSTTSTHPSSGSQLSLRAAPRDLVHACKVAATKVTLPVVYCPPRVPSGQLIVGFHGPFGTGDLRSYVVSAESHSLPAPYVRKAKRQGQPYPPPGHWLVSAAKPPAKERSFIRKTDMGRQVATEMIDGVKAAIYLVPEGGMALDSGHVVILWTLGGIAYTMSVHSHVNRNVAEGMAQALISEMHRCPRSQLPRPRCALAIPTH